MQSKQMNFEAAIFRGDFFREIKDIFIHPKP